MCGQVSRAAKHLLNKGTFFPPTEENAERMQALHPSPNQPDSVSSDTPPGTTAQETATSDHRPDPAPPAPTPPAQDVLQKHRPLPPPTTTAAHISHPPGDQPHPLAVPASASVAMQDPSSTPPPEEHHNSPGATQPPPPAAQPTQSPPAAQPATKPKPNPTPPPFFPPGLRGLDVLGQT